MRPGAGGVLLVGPCPPPHGGVSVHVAGLRRELQDAGVPCALLDAKPGAAPTGDECLRTPGAIGLLRAIGRHGRHGWLIHTHINGHNHKSWLLALAAGLAGATAPARLLTVHSGMAPDHLEGGGARLLARIACRLHDRIICVNEEIRRAVAAAGVPEARLRVLAAAVPSRRTPVELPDPLARWLRGRTPLLSAALAFEPEYRFDLLAAAVVALRRDHPDIGCVVMGSGSQQPQARELIAGSGLEGAVRLTGDVDHDSCLQIIAESDLLVRPTDRDGDALSVREALLLGVPVVASDVGERPPGTILFPAGDFQGLLAAAKRALAGGATARRPPAADGGMAELLGQYREVAGLGGVRPPSAIVPSTWGDRRSA